MGSAAQGNTGCPEELIEVVVMSEFVRVARTTDVSVHLTEACDEGTPHLIVNVETTPAATTPR